jgi:hypothetical protein
VLKRLAENILLVAVPKITLSSAFGQSRASIPQLDRAFKDRQKRSYRTFRSALHSRLLFQSLITQFAFRNQAIQEQKA